MPGSDIWASQLLQSLRNLFASHPVATGKSLEVDVPAQDIQLHTDQTLLLRVLANMTKNGLEAADAGSVRVWFESRAGLPTFVVENPGSIPESALPHIFERSFSTKAAQGRGTGTYSMKLYGERFLKGRVSFESQNGRTRFWISLPSGRHGSAKAPEQTPAPAVAPIPSRPAKHVLFVEDDHSLHRLGKLFLERLGYTVTGFQNGAQAAVAFQAAPESFDLVVTDGRLPGLTGTELAQQIRKIRPGTPVILCTGATDASAAEYQEQGFDGVILKPFSLTSLSEKLHQVLSGKPGEK